MKDKQLYNNSMLEIDELEEKKHRPFSRPPQSHVVFSNYDITFKGYKAYFFDPDKFMLPSSEHDYNIFPPYSSFHIEEGQSGSF